MLADRLGPYIHFRLAVLMVSLLVAEATFATAQIGDVLILDGKKYSIQTNPLEPFLAGNREKLPKSKIISTANWRDYIATWEVNDDRLLLKDIEILMGEKRHQARHRI